MLVWLFRSTCKDNCVSDDDRKVIIKAKKYEGISLQLAVAEDLGDLDAKSLNELSEETRRLQRDLDRAIENQAKRDSGV